MVFLFLVPGESGSLLTSSIISGYGVGGVVVQRALRGSSSVACHGLEAVPLDPLGGMVVVFVGKWSLKVVV